MGLAARRRGAYGREYMRQGYAYAHEVEERRQNKLVKLEQNGETADDAWRLNKFVRHEPRPILTFL
jgi:hypothetical protein